MKRFILSIFDLLLLAGTGAFAQQTFSGQVVDEHRQPFPYVNVVLLAPSDSAFVAGAVSDDRGRFSLRAPETGLLLRVSFVGYTTIYKVADRSDLGAMLYLSDSRNEDNKGLVQETFLDHTWRQESDLRTANHSQNLETTLRLNYQFNDRHSVEAYYDFDRTPRNKWSIPPLPTTVYLDDELYETSSSSGWENRTSYAHSANIYYNGRLGDWILDFNADGLWSTAKTPQDMLEQVTAAGAPAPQEQTVTNRSQQENTLYAAKLVVEHVRDGFLYHSGTYSEESPAISLVQYVNTTDADCFYATLTLAPTIGLWSPQFTAMLSKQWFYVDTPWGCENFGRPVGSFQWDNSFRLLAGFQLDVDFWAETRGDEESFRVLRPSWSMDASLYKGFLDDRLSLQLRATDLFNSSRAPLTLYSGNRLMTIDQEARRRVSLTLRYKFNAAKSKYKGTGAGQSQRDRM